MLIFDVACDGVIELSELFANSCKSTCTEFTDELLGDFEKNFGTDTSRIPVVMNAIQMFRSQDAGEDAPQIVSMCEVDRGIYSYFDGTPVPDGIRIGALFPGEDGDLHLDSGIVCSDLEVA